ncbi:Wzy polymerase domain-containing protein [Variovorax sp. EBFNA2]|uniref:PglL family O-oligosaccharyltransferase n=1 Tax=Variovorax sp. EBFNA2 TaxID=3342097 RepID=UPI0029C01925|nr:Wzy polymerase domain-containing protein [Variovorax boronicumulans]WPG37641.1 Wzy polymerase domain-containing protein [Variovorax boronicumulans]
MSKLSLRQILIFMATGLAGIGWLVPNHYAPWVSAWSDGASIVAFFLMAFLMLAEVKQREHGKQSALLVFVACVSVAAIFFQVIFGKIIYSGDAVVSAFYVFIWFGATIVGAVAKGKFGEEWLLVFLVGLAGISALSVTIALLQWTGSHELGVYFAELKPGGRPFANVAQPNHFGTICFVGLCTMLYIYERKLIGRLPILLLASFFVIGMVLSQSRTGLLQLVMLSIFSWMKKGRWPILFSRALLLFLCVSAFVGVSKLREINELLLLGGGRYFQDSIGQEIRFPYWSSMVDALRREPLWGYGWQQIGAAQYAIALDHPSVGAHFEHSHNLILDLMLWNGVFLGGALVLALIIWGAGVFSRLKDASELWIFAIIAGLFVHSMSEYPLDYAYFLIPLGLLMGWLQGSNKFEIEVKSKKSLCCILILTFPAFLAIAFDYARFEEAFRTLRLETAGIGAEATMISIPNAVVLNQLESFQKFAAKEARPKMTVNELNAMKMAALRFGYPPVLFRYAIALGLNGKGSDAQVVISRICKIHGKKSCQEAAENWGGLAKKYPELLNAKFNTENVIER